MGQYVAPIRDMQFVLHELLKVEEKLKELPAHADTDADIINQVLEEGAKFTSEVLFPLNHSGDREGCHHDAAAKAKRLLCVVGHEQHRRAHRLPEAVQHLLHVARD